MKNKPHVNIPKIDNLKPLVKRILIEILEDDKGESKVNFTSNNLSPFEILGLLDYYKNMHETNMFIENRKKTDGEKLSQNEKVFAKNVEFRRNSSSSKTFEWIEKQNLN